MKNFENYAAFMLLFTLFCVGCGQKSAPQQNGSTAQTAAQNAPDSVGAFILKSEQVAKDLVLAGDILPLERALLYAKVTAFVKHVAVDIGSHVRRGQVLATLEAPEITAKVAEARARLLSAQAKYRSSADTYHRLANAAQTDGVVAAGELERTKNAMLSDSAEEQSALYTLRSTQELERYLSITAPFDGIVTKRSVDVGALVGASSDKPLFELENTASMRIRVAVPEAFSGAMLDKTTVPFAVKAYPDKQFSATLKRQTESIDAATRSETWEFEARNTERSLKAGMVADVKLRFARGVASFVVPPSSVVTTQERRFVIKITGGRTAWVDVTRGIAMKDKIEIFGALAVGDTLVKSGNEELKAEKPVAVRLH